MRRRTFVLVMTVLVVVMPFALSACDNTPAPAPASGLDAATAQQLFERLDRLVAALEMMPHASGTVSAPVPATGDRTLIANETTELVARIENLERELVVLRSRSGGSQATARQTPPLPMQTQAVQQAGEQLKSADNAVKQEARRSLFRLTQPQMLERYGMPSYVHVGANSSIEWAYQMGHECPLKVLFVDGLVTEIN